MQQFKIFKGIENEMTVLEEQINAWLNSADIRVVQMVGNIAPQTVADQNNASHGLSRSEFAPSDVMVMFLYETSAK